MPFDEYIILIYSWAHCLFTMAGVLWLLQYAVSSMCHLWGESRPRWLLWARWYGDHCLVSALTLPRHPRVPMGHTAASPRPRVSSVSSLLTPLTDVSPVKAVKARIDHWHKATGSRGEKLIGGAIHYITLPLLASMRYFSSFVTLLTFFHQSIRNAYITWTTKHLLFI